jgi:hypothetical protein
VTMSAKSVGAVLSPCDRYRYLLMRRWVALGVVPAPPPLVIVMLNPSTADAATNDPTIRKCIGFAERANRSGVVVANLFAYRATDPADLWRAAADGVDVVGPDNDEAIRAAIREDGPTSPFLDPGPGDVLVAWGAAPTNRGAREVHTRRVAQVLGILRAEGRAAVCLGRSRDGSPRHPLMLAYSTRLEPWIST